MKDLEQFSEEITTNPALLEFLKVASRMADLCRTYTILYDSGDYKERVINECEAVMETVERLLTATPQPAHTEQDGWIECSEQLPGKSDEYYLTHSNAGVDVTYFSGRFQDEYATHWMPLPAAPKPESE